MNKIIASSLDNIIELSNTHTSDAPYVTFTIGSPSSVKIIIRDADNDDGYYKEIIGDTQSVISSSSFKTVGIVSLSLLECLKLNNIFYNITLESANTIKAYIDTSIKYSITVEGSGIALGGTYSSYEALSPNKLVVMLQGEIDGNTANISMEKYNNDETVAFNVSSPFEHASFKKPITMSVLGYQVYDSVVNTVTVPYDKITVLPTTLTKFQTVDYSKFYGSGKVHFLTNNENRYYNYNEHYALSVLSDNDISIRKNYYTNSGVFLESQTTCEYIEKNGIRYDIYDTFDLESIELRYNHQVGYVDVYAIVDGEETYPIRFTINAKCEGNNELFFINELGGIDSFNFSKTRYVTMSSDDVSKFYKNNIHGFGDTLEIASINEKRSDVKKRLTTAMIDRDTCHWLNELIKSKYVFEYMGIDNPKYKMVIIDEFNIETATDTDEYELEIEYHDSDNEFTV